MDSDNRPGSSRRLLTAVGFLAGTLACLNAVRDVKALWPPTALWAALQHSERVELALGLALVVGALLISAVPIRTSR